VKAEYSPAVAELIDGIIRGSYHPEKFAWKIVQPPDGNHVLLDTTLGGVQAIFPLVEGEQAQAALDRWSSLFDSVPTWDCVAKWRTAVQSVDRLRNEALPRVETIHQRFEIERERRCEICFPGKD
jgi:hypothetical protein